MTIARWSCWILSNFAIGEVNKVLFGMETYMDVLNKCVHFYVKISAVFEKSANNSWVIFWLTRGGMFQWRRIRKICASRNVTWSATKWVSENGKEEDLIYHILGWPPRHGYTLETITVSNHCWWRNLAPNRNYQKRLRISRRTPWAIKSATLSLTITLMLFGQFLYFFLYCCKYRKMNIGCLTAAVTNKQSLQYRESAVGMLF